MIDSMIACADQQAVCRKGGNAQALGRSQGGLTTKIHVRLEALGRLLSFIVTAGQVGDITQARLFWREERPSRAG